MQRRELVTLTGASLFGAVLAAGTPAAPSASIEALAALLTGCAPGTAAPAPHSLDLRGAQRGGRQGQVRLPGVPGTDVIGDMHWVLPRVQTACTALDGDARLRACTWPAETHHVAASVLLKRRIRL